MIRAVNSTQIDSNFMARETGFPAITVPRLQAMKQTQNTQFTSKPSIELSYSDFPGHCKVNCD